MTELIVTIASPPSLIVTVVQEPMLVTQMGIQGPAGSGGVPVVSPADRAMLGERVWVRGYAIGEVPDTTTQAAIDDLLAQGWPDWAIFWDYLGEAAMTFVIQNILGASGIDAFVILQSGGIFTISDITSDTYSDEISLAPVGELSIDDLLSDTFIEILGITHSGGVVAVTDMQANSVIEDFTIYDASILTLYINGLISSSSQDDLTLIQSGGVLTISDNLSTPVVDSVTLLFHGVLSISDVSATSSGENLNLIQSSGALAVQDIHSIPSIEPISLLFHGALSISDVLSTPTMDTPTIIQHGGTLTIENSIASTTIEPVTLSTVLVFGVADAVSLTSLDSLILIHAGGVLLVDDAQSSTALDELTIIHNEFEIDNVIAASTSDQFALAFAYGSLAAFMPDPSFDGTIASAESDTAWWKFTSASANAVKQADASMTGANVGSTAMWAANQYSEFITKVSKTEIDTSNGKFTVDFKINQAVTGGDYWAGFVVNAYNGSNALLGQTGTRLFGNFNPVAEWDIALYNIPSPVTGTIYTKEIDVATLIKNRLTALGVPWSSVAKLWLQLEIVNGVNTTGTFQVYWDNIR